MLTENAGHTDYKGYITLKTQQSYSDNNQLTIDNPQHHMREFQPFLFGLNAVYYFSKV
jgi:hypothetical protein